MPQTERGPEHRTPSFKTRVSWDPTPALRLLPTGLPHTAPLPQATSRTQCLRAAGPPVPTSAPRGTCSSWCPDASRSARAAGTWPSASLRPHICLGYPFAPAHTALRDLRCLRWQTRAFLESCLQSGEYSESLTGLVIEQMDKAIHRPELTRLLVQARCLVPRAGLSQPGPCPQNLWSKAAGCMVAPQKGKPTF